MDTMSEPDTTRKRVRQVVAKPGELRAAWGRAAGDGPDICGAWHEPAEKSDMNLLLGCLCFLPASPRGKSLVAELMERGYDLRTLKFSVHKAIAQAVKDENGTTVHRL